ncbi:hypothetical protein DFH07DRAFT_843276 [Mycena maculata]|uniref:FAD-binding PCMH-type domain-containing protein n=1 Tax=Mycena maculata TaxID=230809 RepID=A0AAD7I7T9_9AGAR|nr:hypothetical protein DFH07DRAFT_843276 [Mycena maculata]
MQFLILYAGARPSGHNLYSLIFWEHHSHLWSLSLSLTMHFHFWLTLASSTVAVFAQDGQRAFNVDAPLRPSVLNETALASSLCCSLLNSTFPTKTLFPDDAEYEEQQQRYYSAQQREVQPACRFSPASAQELSVAVQIATQNECTFAVKSGGHMNWGGSNIGPAGFAIDLGNLNEVSVHPDEGIVSFGSGCVWREVYEALEPYNLTTAGGRASNVGVGGFLTGGGMSFLSIEHGLGSDNIVNYLVVLADGTISNANATSDPDLYWALKYGSTNFGVVARFDMATYPLDLLWGGSLYFPVSEAHSVLDFLVDLVPNLAADPRGMTAIIIGLNPDTQTYVVWTVISYRAATPFPPLFAPLHALEPQALASTMRIDHLVNFTDELRDVAPSGLRAQWVTLTLVPDAQMMMDLFTKGAEIFDPHRVRPGFTWGVSFQPVNSGLAAAGTRRGGNPSGLSPDSGDLILSAITVTWVDPADDAILKATTQAYLAWARELAAQRGLLNKFIYLNYAFGTQDVFGAVGDDNLVELRRIRGIYDPEGVFGKYWVGGYKL